MLLLKTWLSESRQHVDDKGPRIDAEVGDELILVSHDPFTGSSEYRSASPIFLHRTPCKPARLVDSEVPLQLARRQLSVRAFDLDEMMIDAVVIDGAALGETIARLFADPQSDHIHVHNASGGCWAATVVRC